MSSILEKCSVNPCAARRGVRFALLAMPLLLLVAMLAPSAKAQVPINDNFFNATALTGAFGTTNGTTVGATFEFNEPFHYSSYRLHSVWYRWVAPTNGLVTFDTLGTYVGSGTFFFDSVLAAYIGPNYGQLVRLASNDDYFSLDSLVSFFAVAGVEYHIAVDGFSGDFGPFVLNWNQGNGTNIPPSAASNEVAFASSAFGVEENTPGFITVSVVSGGGFTNVSTVDYYTVDGTAVAGQDYLSVSNTLTFGPGDTVKVFTIPILDNSIQHSNKTINLVLANPTFDAAIGSISNAVVTIIDDETPIAPTRAGQFNIVTTNSLNTIFGGGFFFANQNLASVVTENETFRAPFGGIVSDLTRSVKGAMVTVTRTAPASGRVLVDYYTTNTFLTNFIIFGTNFYFAQPGIDYQPVTGTLLFDDYQMMANFIVPIGPGSFFGTATNFISTPLFFDVVLTNPRPAPEEDPAEIVPTIGVGQASVEILQINNFRGYSIERRTYRADEYASFARGGTNVIGTTTTPVTNDVVVTTFVVVTNGVGQVSTNFTFTTNQVVINAVTTNTFILEFDIILPGGGGGNFSVDVDLAFSGQYYLQPGSDYADGFLANFDDTPYTDGSPDLVNQIDYGPITPDSGSVSTVSFRGSPNGIVVRVPFPTDTTFRRRVRVPIRVDSVVEFNEDIGIFIVDWSPNSVSSGNRFASATILYNDVPSGAADREWNQEGVLFTNPRFNDTPGANNTVSSVAVQPDDKTIIGGDFDHYNSITRNHLARINSDGSLDTSFNPGSGADGSVNALALYPTNNPFAGRIVIGGFFSSYNGAQRNGIARVNPNGTLDPTFAPGNGADGIVYAVALQNDGKIIVAGDFETFNDLNVNGIMRLNPDGSLDATFNPGVGANGAIWAIIVSETALGERSIYIAGEFTTFNGTEANRVARLTDLGDVDPSFNAGLGANQTVYALAIQADGKVIVGGSFDTFHTSVRRSIARVNTDGTLDLSYNVGVGVEGSVYAITLQPDGKALIGGPFTSYNNTRRMGMARIHTSGVLDTSFMDTAYNQFAGFPKTFSFDNPSFVNSIALQSDGNLMVGGSFTNVGGNLSVHFNTTNQTTTAVSVTNTTGFFTLLGFDYQPVNGRTNGHNSGAHLFAPFTRQDKTARLNVARIIGDYTPGPGNVEYDPNSSFSANENNGSVTVTLRRVDGRLGTAVAVPFTTNNTALFPVDFSSSTSTQIWEEWTPTINAVLQRPFSPRSVGYALPLYFDVPLLDDLLAEGDETFGLAITNAFGSITLGGEYIPLGTAIGHTDFGSATIADNEFNKGIFNFGAVSYMTNEDAGLAIISVIRTNGSSGAVTVDYLTRDGSATAGSDYTTTRGQLRFASGETNKTFSIPILDNPDVEFDETVILVLTNATGGAKLPAGLATSVVTNTLTIVDNDFLQGRLQFSISNYTNNENEAFGTVTVTRSGGNKFAMTVQYQTISGGTATPNVDYTPVSGMLVWTDGDSSAKTFTIPLLPDGVVENPESILLRLSNPSVVGSLGSRTNATLWITDGDAFGNLSFSQLFYEVDENGSSPTITVVRSGGSAGTVTVNYQSTPIVATPGTDYSDVTGTLTFGPGEFSKTFAVPVIDDSVPDGDKTVQLTLSNPTGGGLGAITNVVLTIVDNESISLPAGELDTTFSTNANANAAVYALVQQQDGRIIMAGDFTQVSSVPRNRLARLKPNGLLDNTFDIGPGANGSIRALAIGSDGKLLIGGLFTTINGTNRNGVARLSTDGTLDASFNPGSGADNPVFTLALQGNGKLLVGGSFVTFNGITRPGLVRLNTNGTVDGSFNIGSGFIGAVYAVALQNDGKVIVGGDFTSFNNSARTNILRLNGNGTLDTTFNPSLVVNGAVRAILVEPDGRVVIGGSFTRVNGTERRYLARVDGNGILDGGFVDEPLMGADNTVYALQQQIDGRILVTGDFHVFNGVTRNGITRLYDEDGSTDPTINFGNGANGFVAALVIQPDRRIVIGGGFTRYDDKARHYIARIYGGAIAGAGSLEFSSPLFTVSESTTNAVISVRRIGGTGGSVSVDFHSTTNGTAVAGVDYLATSGTLTFAEGETRQVFTVSIVSNSIPDGDRYLQLILSNFVGAAQGPSPFTTLVILDDESTVGFTAPTFTVGEASVSGNATVSLVRRGGTNTTVSVTITSVDGSATANFDYAPTNAIVTFLPGELTKNFNVHIFDDALIEGSETFNVLLSNPSGVTALGLASAVVTINDNDSGPGRFLFATNSFVVDEFAGFAVATILRTNGSSGSAQVRFTTSNGTAVNGSDYFGTNTLVTFGEGETAKNVLFPIVNDAITEPDETIILTLSQPSAGTTIVPGQGSAIMTIADDEFSTSYVGFAMNLFFVNEADVFATITVTRTNNRRGVVEVDFSVANGSATAGFDYGFTNGTVTLLDNVSSATFTIPVFNDLLSEGDETVLLSLSNVRSTNTSVVLALANAALIISDRVIAVSGNVDPTFADNIGANAPVHSVAFDAQQRLIAGGEFTQVWGLAANRFARFTTNGAVDFSFQIGSGANDTVFGVSAVTNVIIGTNTVVNFTNLVVNNGPITNSVTNSFISGTNIVVVITTSVLTNNTYTIVTSNSSFVLGSRIYLGGAFTNVSGTNFSRVARLNDNGSVDPLFQIGTGANGTVRAVTPYAFHTIVAGDFTTFDGRQARRIARLNNDGSYDATFNTTIGANGSVRAVAVQPNGQIIIAGDFSTVNGFAAPRVARLNADGSFDPFFFVPSGADDTVRSIAIQADGKIILGGSFLTFDGVARARLIRLNPNGGVDLSFNTGAGLTGGDVRSVAVQSDGRILVVGAFTGASGNAVNRIARLNPDGSIDTFFAIGSGADGQVNSVATFALPVPTVCSPPGFVALDFESFSNTNLASIASLNTNCVSFFGPTGGVFYAVSNTTFFGGTAAELRIADGGFMELNVSGRPFSLFSMQFVRLSSPVIITSSSGGQRVVTQSGFAIFDSTFSDVQWVRIQLTGGAATLDNVQIFSSPVLQPLPTDRIAVGGDFLHINGVPRHRVALLDFNGGVERMFDPGAMPSHTVYAIDTYNVATNGVLGKVLAGGDFTALVGVEGINHLGRLNTNGTLDTTFTNGVGPNDTVRAIAIQPDGMAIIGGFFTSYNFVQRNFLARVNTDGTVDPGFNFGVGLDNAVLALALQPDGKTVVGGNFTAIYGSPRSFIGRVQTNGTVDTTFVSSANGPVHAIALQPDGLVLIGGQFTAVNGIPQNRIARLNANGTLDTTFNAGSGPNAVVNAIALTPGGQILIGGAFTQLNGNGAPYLGRLNSDGSFDSSFNTGGTGANDTVNTIKVQPDGKILVGGNFTVFNGQLRNRIFRLLIDGQLDPVINFGTGANDIIATISLQSDNSIMVGGAFTVFNDQVRVGIARLLGGDTAGNGAFQFGITNYFVSENSNSVTLAVVRTGSTIGSASVEYTMANGTATSPAHYIASSGTLNFVQAENVKLITVPIVDNTVPNPDRFFTVTLSNPFGGPSLGSNQIAFVTIVENESTIGFTADSYTVTENGGSARITVVRTGGASERVTVDYVTLTNGTATGGVDFTVRNATLVFNPGVRTLTFDVPITDDLNAEFNETVPLVLFNIVGPAVPGRTNALLTIIENDFGGGVFVFSTNSYSISEDGGFIVIDVYRTNGHSGVASVGFGTTTGGIATSGVDYFPTNGTLTFADGQTNASFTVRLIDDSNVEGNETVPLVLFGPSGGATIGGGNATLTINDNDAPGQFTFSQPVYTVTESGTFATITILRTNGNVGNVSVTFQTSGGTATPGVDYTSVNTVVNFAAGQTVRSVQIPIFNDSLIEGNETVQLLLSNPQPAGGFPNGPDILNQTAMLNILDDEISVTFSQPQFFVTEAFTSAVISVDRRGDPSVAFSVGVNTSPGTATAGQDYFNTSLVLNFAAGETNKTFLVSINDDTIPEGDEIVNLTLSNPSSGVTLQPLPSAQLIIVDDDIGFSFSSAVYSVLESAPNVTITVIRTGSTNPAVSVDFATSDGTATSLLFTNDYFTITGRLAFAAGETSRVFGVTLQNDTIVEGDEFFNLTLANPSPGTGLGGQPTAIVNIIEDDTGIGFSSPIYVVNEKGTNAVITVIRTGNSSNAVSARFRTQNGTATAGVDYVAITTTLSWGSGDATSRTLLIPIADDGVTEGIETVGLFLDLPTGGATIDLTTGTATLNIVDNAGSIAFASATYNVVEGDGNAVINLVRSGGSNGTVSVAWSVTGGSAINGQDYFGSSGTVVFSQGETQKPIIIPINDDSIVEGLESLTLALSNAGGGARVGSPGSALLRIFDNDAGVIVAAGSALVAENLTTNSIIEPGEIVTLQLALRNNGTINDTITATLVYGNGTGVSPTNAQAATNLQQRGYGELVAGGDSVSRPFTFLASGSNGTRLTVTLLLTNNLGVFLGDVTFSYTIGRAMIPFANSDVITLPDSGVASPYPSTLTVSGFGGPLTRLTVTLYNVSHDYPDDLDIVLVAPDGRNVMLMSDAGNGGSGTANAMHNLTITFDDAAAFAIPDFGVISNGTYRCGNYAVTNDPFAPPGPLPPYGTSLSTFNNMNPNGVWSLYIYDDAPVFGGSIAGGWSLNIQSGEPVIPGADISLKVTDSPDPVATNGLLTYTIAVTNVGPANANAVFVTNTLAPDATFVNLTPAGTRSGSTVTLNFGSLPAGAGTIGTITVRAPGSPAQITFNATAGAGEQDLNPVNNVASIQTTVFDPNAPPASGVPTLYAARAGNNVVLSWQTQTNIVLETRASISSGSWSTSSATVTTSSGTSSATVPISGGASFFRLRRTP